jgi:TrmH family RNA methyltransferase
MERITSRQNPKIKQVRSLRERKGREESGLFLVEGIRHVGEAAEAGAGIQAIFYAPERLTSPFAVELIRSQAARGVPCYETTLDIFESLADKGNPQGILAIVRQPDDRLADLSPEQFTWGVALVAPQDPGNVGAILRTIDAVGASGLLILGNGVDPYHPVAVRASMGANFWHPVVRASFADFADWVRQHGYTVYGTSAHGSRDYRQMAPYRRPLILLMGSEREGLAADQAAICQEMIRLPMHGRATSLNLAVAAGILLYSILDNSVSE